MDLEKNKQRLEILAAELEELKRNGGGGTSDSYTKEEADDKFAEKTNVYTKTEADNKFAETSDLPDLNDYLTKVEGETLYISKELPIIGGTVGEEVIPDNNNKNIMVGNISRASNLTSGGGIFNSTTLGKV